MTYRIWKRFTFAAAHSLEELPPTHKCARLHGHNYAVEIELSRNSLDSIGFVRDYGDLADVKAYIDSDLDHRNLNDILPMNPTAENLAAWLWHRFFPAYPELSAVRVYETESTGAEYRP